MNLFAKLFTLAALLLATLVLPLALLADLPGSVGDRLLVLVPALAAAAYLIASFSVREIAALVRRLAEATSEAATGGRLWRGTAVRGGREVRLLEKAFRNLAFAVEESQRGRENSYVEAIGAVVAAVDARDHETSGHSFRVSRYALALARGMGIDDPEQLRAVEWGALLHDVGKIAVPDAILRKVGPLTEDEWRIMRQHPSWGYEILADVSFLRPALAIVYSHHERWDGAGYPRGLKGASIPLTARIFAVVDTYDAITSDRPYRRARGHAAAVAELDRVAGRQLDPQVVEAFLSVSEVELRRLRDGRRRLDLGLPVPLEADNDDEALPAAGG